MRHRGEGEGDIIGSKTATLSIPSNDADESLVGVSAAERAGGQGERRSPTSAR